MYVQCIIGMVMTLLFQYMNNCTKHTYFIHNMYIIQGLEENIHVFLPYRPYDEAIVREKREEREEDEEDGEDEYDTIWEWWL